MAPTLYAAIELIRQRVTVMYETEEACEFLTNTGVYIELQRMPEGWRVRANYPGGRMREVHSPDVMQAVDEARRLATRRRTPFGGRTFDPR